VTDCGRISREQASGVGTLPSAGHDRSGGATRSVRNHDERDQHRDEHQTTRHRDQRCTTRGVLSPATEPASYRRRSDGLGQKESDRVRHVSA
jgi:hypothetical protein